MNLDEAIASRGSGMKTIKPRATGWCRPPTVSGSDTAPSSATAPDSNAQISHVSVHHQRLMRTFMAWAASLLERAGVSACPSRHVPQNPYLP
jgi:hypothetical protein